MDISNNKSPYYSFLKNIATLLLFLASLFLIFFSLNSSKSLITSQSLLSWPITPHPTQITERIPKDELREVLERISTENKTLIITVINKAYVQGEVVPNMLDLFLEGLWEGVGTRELVNHLIGRRGRPDRLRTVPISWATLLQACDGGRGFHGGESFHVLGIYRDDVD